MKKMFAIVGLMGGLGMVFACSVPVEQQDEPIGEAQQALGNEGEGCLPGFTCNTGEVCKIATCENGGNDHLCCLSTETACCEFSGALVCTNLHTDPHNCGTCRNDCDGFQCINGLCSG